MTRSHPQVLNKTHLPTKDEALLAELGYKQEFKREFSIFSTCAFALSIMGAASSVTSTLSFGLAGGGHFGLVWGWFIPGFFVVFIAASLSELCSAMPTSGGLYYWSSALSPPTWGPFASWCTAYMNVTGQVALVCSIAYTVSEMIAVLATVASDFEIAYSLGVQFAIFVSLLFGLFIICSSATKVLARLTYFYVLLNLSVTFATIVCFAVVPTEHASTSDAFFKFENGSSWGSGLSFLLAFTAPMWSLTGYDSPAHVAEETSNAEVAGPTAIMSSVVVTWILGFAMLIATSFAITDVGALLSTPLALPMAQLYYDILGKHGMLTIWSFIIVVQFVTAASQTVDASRVVFALARDDGLPGSKWWKKINSYTQTPVNAVALVLFLSALLGLMALNLQAGLALFDVAVIGEFDATHSLQLTAAYAGPSIALYVSYAIPIVLRITSGRNKLKAGPFSLGSYSVPIGTVSVTWVSFILVILLFPSNPAPDATNMNYAVVVLGAVVAGSMLYWVLSARHWFQGPIRNVSITRNDSGNEGSFGSAGEKDDKSEGTAHVVDAVDLK